MASLSLDSLTIYGLDTIPISVDIDGDEVRPSIQLRKQIIEIRGLKLTMHENHTITWKNADISIVEPPGIIITDPKYRVDCYPDYDEQKLFCMSNRSPDLPFPTITSALCEARGCTWNPIPAMNVSSCYIPLEKGGYNLTGPPNQLSDAIKVYSLTRLSTKPIHIQALSSAKFIHKPALSNQVTKKNFNEFSMFGKDIDDLDVQISLSGSDKIRMTIRDANTKRYEVPVPIRWQPSASSLAKLNFEITKTPHGQVGFRVQRTSTLSTIFDTSFFANGFIYDDQFIQVITRIPSRNIYGKGKLSITITIAFIFFYIGFGENTHPSFRHVLKGSSRYGTFARDQPPEGNNENLYGTHPFYMVIESDGQAFGVFILNSNAQDYKFDEFDNDQAMLTYRTVGGILDVFFFAGPRPEDVIRQYQTVIGNPYMPPYWGLGFQLCRYGYNTLDNMKAATLRTLNANIPLDVM